MGRVSHILLVVFVIGLLKWPAMRLRKYWRLSSDPTILAAVGRVVIADIMLFAVVYAWFNLFSWQDLAVFMALNVAAAVLPYLLWLFYKPIRVPVKSSFLQAYIELHHTRRWLSITLIVIGLLASVAASINLYVGFARLHDPDYRSVFAIIAVSMGIYLVGAAIPCCCMLISAAVDSSARIRLLLALYSTSTLVFICAFAAGPNRVIPSTKFYLLTKPDRFQVSLNIAIITAIVLLIFTIAMSIGEVKQAGKLQESSEFQETLLRKLRDGLLSPARIDKLSFIDSILRELCERQSSLDCQLVLPGRIIERLHKFFVEKFDQTTSPEGLPATTAAPDLAVSEEPSSVSDRFDETPLEEKHTILVDEAELAMEEHLKRITDNTGLWNTADSWDERVTELQTLATHASTLVKKGSDDFLEELEKFRCSKHYLVRLLGYRFGNFISRSLANMLETWISRLRQWADYLAWAKSKDIRWRHYFWLQSLMADLTHMREKLQSLPKDSQKKKYITECMDSINHRLEDASRMATDAQTNKRFGARVIVPFSVPFTMAVITPFLHIALGFKP